ncbi:MAG: hypothetical protein AUG89_10015 [Acidobacteria bacterium 13_1_20CM_4_56_7]|nr:MAG: hypothetical protein AUG89_10015 [Acidobacteria bacterium 13_1_20CM_4_56_7]
MVTSLGVLSKGRIAQAKASVNSQQNDSAGLMELRDLLSHEVVPRTLFPCSLFASAANSPNEFDIHDPLCLVPSSTRQCKKPPENVRSPAASRVGGPLVTPQLLTHH